MLSDIRNYFEQYAHNPTLCYLDSAASSLTPNSVIKVMNEYYTQYRANVHRGLYPESMQATDEYQLAREKIARFIGAAQSEEVIFTRGATDGLNMVSEILEDTLQAGQSIVTTVAEHHSNFLPWQRLARRKGVDFRVVDLDQEIVSPEDVVAMMDDTTKIVAVSQVSNVLGNVLDLHLIRKKADEVGAILVVDGCQAVAHLKIDVHKMGADFYVFSGHKMYGPTGIGVLYGRREVLEGLSPQRLGGGMVSAVTQQDYTPAPLPERFEPGTPMIAEAIGLGVAVDFLEDIGMHEVFAHTQKLVEYTWKCLESRRWITVLGEYKNEGKERQNDKRVGVFSLVIDGVHSGDLTQLVVSQGIAVRGGHHCAEPLSTALRINGSLRLSYGIYTTTDDIDQAFKALDEAKNMLG